MTINYICDISTIHFALASFEKLKIVMIIKMLVSNHSFNLQFLYLFILKKSFRKTVIESG